MRILFSLGLLLSGSVFASALDCNTIDVTFTPSYHLQVQQSGLAYLVTGQVTDRDVTGNLVTTAFNAPAQGTLDPSEGTQVVFSNGSLVAGVPMQNGIAKGSLQLNGREAVELVCRYL